MVRFASGRKASSTSGTVRSKSCSRGDVSMAKDCIINELSLRDVDESRHEVTALLDRLAELPSFMGRDVVVWACKGLWDQRTTPGRAFQSCMRAVYALPRYSDRRRRVLSFLQHWNEFSE